MAAIRNGILVLLICALPTSASAGCGPFSPCGSPSWIGFSLALPVPRLPHLRPFAVHSCQSPLCGCGPVGYQGGYGFGGCGLLGHGCYRGFGFGHRCGTPCCPPIPQYAPPLLSAPPTLAPPTLVPHQSTCNPCEMSVSQMQLIPQQTVSYRDVPQIQYRQEAYTESVPVTAYQQVTRTRTVPYQTVTRIPQISTQYVPQMTATFPCNPCAAGSLAPIYGAPASTAALPYSPTPIAMPQTAGVPEYPYPVTQPETDANSAWQPIPRRQAQEGAGADIQQMGFHPSLPRSTRPQASGRSLFQPAPSAASVWQSRFLR